jgi:2-polyprenyl-6-methoxyphenol hydroxylase-like FAD-dependent oxidoreductase
LTGPSYDIVTVGGGIAGATLAKAMAEQGVNVLVLEREGRFKDRVRGEMVVPWGAAEARELHILDVLKDSCAHEVSLIETGSGLRDLKTTTLQQLPALTFAHPEMQDSLLAAAEGAGAKVRRGITVERIEPGARPAVIVSGPNHERIETRMVVAADGRESACRKWAGFTVREQANDYYMAGVLLSGVHSSSDVAYYVFNPVLGTVIGLLNIGGDRFRAYFMYPKSASYRLQGAQSFNLFSSESAMVFPQMSEIYEGAKCIGPLASFDVSDSWVEHPYRQGVVLVGDAAATSDPTFGQGLSLALRDVHILRDELSGTSDWESAGNHYAEKHDKYFGAAHTVEGWFRTLFQDPSSQAAQLRAQAMPRIAVDPSRVPDHLFSGPDLPLNNDVRARFFGEC